MTTKTEAKHTPGPWKISGQFIQDLKTCKMPVREITYTPADKIQPDIAIGWIWDENTANSGLIAAAPELLEAAKKLCKVDNYIVQEYWDKLRAAIAKAEGEK